MRAKSAAFCVMASPWAANFGATAVSMACTSGVLIVSVKMENRVEVRSSALPDRSSAAMVFSNEGAAGLLAMASTSRSSSAMPYSSAGWKSATRSRSNGGSPPCGPVHSVTSTLFAIGLLSCGVVWAAAAVAVVFMANPVQSVVTSASGHADDKVRDKARDKAQDRAHDSALPRGEAGVFMGWLRGRCG